MARLPKEEIKEVTFDSLFESKYETRKSNNLAPDIIIPTHFVKKIEGGITIEELESMSCNGLPILTYKTQVTIHGVFPELDMRVGGYKNVFTNGNGSLGVKYSAIDYSKKNRILSALKFLGWCSEVTSQKMLSYKVEFLDNLSNPEKIARLSELKNFVNSIDTSLFKGYINLVYGRNFFGSYLANIDLEIYSIYERDVETLFFQLTSKNLKEVEELMRLDRLEKERVEELKRLEYNRKQALREEAIKKRYAELAIDGLVNKTHVISEGLVTVEVRCNDEMVIWYNFTEFYKRTPRSKKLCYETLQTKEFLNVGEVLERLAKTKGGYVSHECYSTKTSGIKLK
jgi:hypothetical protein